MASRIQTSVMIFFAAIMLTLSLFAPLAMAASFAILAIYPTYVFIRQGNLKNIWGDSDVNKVILVLLTYALISSLWAIKPSDSVSLWIRMLLFFIGALALFSYVPQIADKEKIIKTLLCGIMLAITIANIEAFTGGVIIKNLRLYTDIYLTKSQTIRPPVNDYVVEMNRGGSVLSIFSWAALCYLYGKGQFKTAVLLYGTVLLTLLRMESLSTVLGFFVAGIFVFPLVLFKGKNVLRVFAVLAVIGVFAGATAAAVLDAHKAVGNVPVIAGAASDIRLYIYDYAAKQALKKPVFGWGFNSSRNYPVEKKDYVQNGRSPLPLHPHNNTLQVWLELGAVGVVMFAAFLALLLIRISNSKYPKYIMASCAGLFTNYFVIGQTGYGIWQNWWVGSGIIAITLLLLVANISQQKNVDK